MTRRTKEESNNTQEHFSDLLNDTTKKWAEIIEHNKKINTEAQQIIDLSNAVKPLTVYIPQNKIKDSIIYWEFANNQADLFLSSSPSSTSASTTSTGGTIAFAARDIGNAIYFPQTVSQQEKSNAEINVNTIMTITNNNENEYKAIELMEKFGLNNSTKGQKSPLSLFCTAFNAYKTPLTADNPIITSLIPLREALEKTIEQLLKKRKYQEKTPTWRMKIKSIGNQLKIESVSEEAIDVWADQFVELLDKYLSPAKDQDISREQWLSRLQQGTLFLISFLSGINPINLN